MTETENQRNGVLTNKELTEVIQMASQIYNGGYGRVFSPQTSNQLLIERTGDVSIPTRDKVRKLLAQTDKDDELLRAYNGFANTYSLLYSRTVDYYAGLLNFDYTIAPINAKWDEIKKDPDKMKEYKEDEDRIYKFFERFAYKRDGRTLVKKALLNGKAFGWFRNTICATNNMDMVDDNVKTKKTAGYAIQTMPFQYCLITGQDENEYLYDINMNWFLQAGVDINTYDPIFRQYMKDTFVYDSVAKTYVPSAPACKRNGVWGQWHQTSLQDGAICIVADYTNPEGSPFLTPLINNILTDGEIAELQRDADMIAAKGILYGQIPLLDNQKSGEVADAMAWKPETLTMFLALVKAGLDRAITAVAMPTENNKFDQYDLSDTKDMYGTQLETTAGNAASASRIIYSSGKASQEELRLQVQTDYNRVEPLYRQFEKIFGYFANKCTRTYKFAITFSGCTYDFMKKQESENILKLADKGIVLHPSVYAKVADMPAHIFAKSLEAGHYAGMADLLTPLISIHTASASSAQGRPTMDVGDRSESANNNYE
ncbi:MAG: hypothetical protein KBT06_11530 [Prevotellaceae bacterium]|nr:hypothetical protein [Candidatus Colivivens equi]